MAGLQQFRLPDVGEGLTDGEILQWLVSVGETVTVNQSLVEVETAKAAVELPSPYAGVVTELLAAPGETVQVGTPIITIDTGAPGTGVPSAPALPADPQSAPVAAAAGPDPSTVAGARQLAATEFVPTQKPQREAVLVGYGVMSGSVHRRPRRAVVAPVHAVPDGGSAAVRAKPPVRKLAKDLGVDLAVVRPTGPDGTVTREDVQREAAAAQGTAQGTAQGGAGGVVLRPAAVGGALQGERREEVRGVRKHMAEAMVR